MRRKASAGDIVAADLEILPLMGLFVVLIPMLLLSAVFLELAVVKMSLPGEAEAALAESRGLGLTVAVGPESYVVRGEGIETEIIARDTTVGSDEEADGPRALRLVLEEVAARFPGEDAMTVLPRDETRYEDIIGVMDAGRESGFGRVSLAGGGVRR